MTTTIKTPPPAAPTPDPAMVNEQARMLRQYEEQQAALLAAREAEERHRQELEEQQRREFEQRQAEQAERERMAQEQLMQQQLMQYSNQAAAHSQDLERELLGMRGQFERDQLMLEQYDRVRDSYPVNKYLCSCYGCRESKLSRVNLGAYQRISTHRCSPKMT